MRRSDPGFHFILLCLLLVFALIFFLPYVNRYVSLMVMVPVETEGSSPLNLDLWTRSSDSKNFTLVVVNKSPESEYILNMSVRTRATPFSLGKVKANLSSSFLIPQSSTFQQSFPLPYPLEDGDYEVVLLSDRFKKASLIPFLLPPDVKVDSPITFEPVTYTAPLRIGSKPSESSSSSSFIILLPLIFALLMLAGTRRRDQKWGE